MLIDPNQILYADTGQANVTVARSASVQLSDSPTSSATTLTSLFQSNLVGLRSERWCGFARAQASSVIVIDDIQFGGS